MARNKSIRVIELKANENIQLGEYITLEVIWPNVSKIIKENEINNESLVFNFKYYDFKILFTGDIEKIAEQEIIRLNKENLKCDILKVAHHGSKTSSIQEFLEYAKPKVALIGVGKDNKFGHPSNDVINRLNKLRYKNLQNRWRWTN